MSWMGFGKMVLEFSEILEIFYKSYLGTTFYFIIKKLKIFFKKSKNENSKKNQKIENTKK